MKALVVDDQRIFADAPEYEWTHATTSQDGYQLLVGDGPWDEIWLDHDLGMESEGSGYDLVHQLIDHIEGWGYEGVPAEDVIAEIVRPGAQVFVHSMNPSGADRMVKALAPYFSVSRIDPTPFLDFDKMYSQDRNPYLAGPRR